MRRCVLLLTALLPLAAAAENIYPTRSNFTYRGTAMGSPGTAVTPFTMWLPLTQVGAPYSSAYSLLWRGWVEGGVRTDSGSLASGINFNAGGAAIDPSLLPTTQATGAWGGGGSTYGTGLVVPAATRMVCQLWTTVTWPTAYESTPLIAQFWDSLGTSTQVSLPAGGGGGGASMSAGAGAVTTNYTVPGLNAVCFGCAAAGTTGYIKLNLGTTASNATACTADWSDTQNYTSTVMGTSQTRWAWIEGVILDSAWNEATAVEIQRRWLGLYQGGNLLTVTRAGLKTVPINGFVSHVAAGIPAVAGDGLLVDKATTNYILYSGAMSSGSAGRTGWSLSGATLTTRTGEAPDKTDSTRIASSTGSGALYRTTANHGSTTGPFELSSYVKSDSTADDVALLASCNAGNATSATCLRSDGGACTASTSAGSAWVDANVGASWVRLSLRYSCTSPGSTTVVYLHPGVMNSGTGTADFAMSQFEVQPYITGYQRSEGTATARAEDLVYAAVPAGVPTSSWSIVSSHKPAENVGWIGGTSGSVGRNFWGINTAGVANSARLDINSGNNGMQTYVYGASNNRTRLTTGVPAVFTTGGNANRVGVCSRYGANIENWIPVLDGAPYTGAFTISGAGSGQISTWPSGQPFFLGTTGAGGGTGLWTSNVYLYGKEVCR